MTHDSIAITDSIALTLNDINTLFETITDSLAIDDSILDVETQPVLSDTLTMSATIAFGKEFRIYENFAITEDFPRITGLLFGYEEITDTMAIGDTTITIVIPELVITEAGDNILTEAGDGLEIE